jgi:hypothetical protein
MIWRLSLLITLLNSPLHAAEAPAPLCLHPDNPHYFLFRGKPAILVTSGEHYGAVLNRDFDYIAYLDELKARGFNLTRTFSGTYFEVPGSFGIVDNTLAPARGRYLGPFARSDQAGAGDGGNRFDLTKVDADYFTRLEDFVTQAGKRGIVVELVLFCTIYDDKLWHVSPFRPANNLNAVGKVERTKVFALAEDGLTKVQEALTRRLVAVMRDRDNVHFEVCNEPYFAGVTREWQDRIIATIVDAEKGLPARHLIAQNIANGSARIDKPNPAVSIFNFHYATPPTTVGVNWALDRPIGDDETGFRGTSDEVYRTEAWEFLLAGGAAFSNLDYSFSCKHTAGTAKVTSSPGGGGGELRKQLAFLKRFLEGFDFVKMKPAGDVVRQHRIQVGPQDGKKRPPSVTALAEVGKQYAIYVRAGTSAELTLKLPEGGYRAEWLNPRSGKVEKTEEIDHRGGERTLTSPPYSEDVALRILRR